MRMLRLLAFTLVLWATPALAAPSAPAFSVKLLQDGQTFDYKVAEIYHMKDGKITARWAFSDDTAKIIEFFR